MDDEEPPQIWLNYLQGGDRGLHRFLKCIQTKKKKLKFSILALFGNFSAENRNKTEVGTKGFSKNTFLKKITKLTFVSDFTVNKYFPTTMSWPNT